MSRVQVPLPAYKTRHKQPYFVFCHNTHANSKAPKVKAIADLPPARKGLVRSNFILSLGRLPMLMIRYVFNAIPVIPAAFGAITKLGLGVRPLGDATDGAGMERLIALD